MWMINYWKRQSQTNLNLLIEIENLEKRVAELEKIIKNQPLIKKYQKTLDIFLKNAKNK